MSALGDYNQPFHRFMLAARELAVQGQPLIEACERYAEHAMNHALSCESKQLYGLMEAVLRDATNAEREMAYQKRILDDTRIVCGPLCTCPGRSGYSASCPVHRQR